MLNSASMQSDSREGAFLFIQLAFAAIILFPWHKGIWMTGLPTSPQINLLSDAPIAAGLPLA